MKRNKILALGLSAILGVSAVPADVKAFQSLANEIENSEITDVAVEENNKVENSLKIETAENEIVETEEQIKENEEVQSEEQVDIKNEIATLPLFDEDVEILNTSEPTQIQQLTKVDYSTIKEIDLGAKEFEDLVNITADGSLSLFWFTKLPRDKKFDIIIPEQIKNITVKKIISGAFSKADNISKVTIKGDIEIGDFAFKESTITNLEAPSAKSIGSSAFEFCSSLTTVNAPKVTTIGTYAFSNSSKLTEANFPLVKKLDKYAFKGCSELKSINFPELTTISGTQVFADCKTLKEVNLPKLETLQNASLLLAGCESLETLNLPVLKSLENSQKILYLKDGTTSSLKTLNMQSLEELKDTSTFANCVNLTDVNLDGLKTVPSNFFEKSSSLSKVSMNGLTEIPSGLFEKSKNSLTNVSLNSLKNIPKSEFLGYKNLSDVSFENLEKIENDNVFFGCTNLENINMPKLKSITGNNTFYQCTSLKTINFPVLETINSHYTFAYCSNLETIDFPTLTFIKQPSEIISATPQNKGGTFYGCTKLKTVKLPILETIDADNVFNSEALEEIHFPNLKNINAKNTFYKCNNLKTVTLPALETINGDTTFFSCKNLESINLPALKTINGNSTFFNSNVLTNLELISLETINGRGTFHTCAKLENVSLPTLETINGGNIVLSSDNLTELSLPSLTSLSKEAFLKSSSLKRINLLNENVKITSNENEQVFNENTTVYISRYVDLNDKDKNKEEWNAKEVHYYVDLKIKDQDGTILNSSLTKDNLPTVVFSDFEIDESKLSQYEKHLKINEQNEEFKGWKVDKSTLSNNEQIIKSTYVIKENTTLVPVIDKKPGTTDPIIPEGGDGNNTGTVVVPPTKPEIPVVPVNPEVDGNIDTNVDNNIDTNVDNNIDTNVGSNTDTSVDNNDNTVVEEIIQNTNNTPTRRNVTNTLTSGISFANLNSIEETDINNIENAISEIDNSLLSSNVTENVTEDLNEDLTEIEDNNEVQKPAFGFEDNNIIGITMTIFFLLLILILIAAYVIRRQQQNEE